LRHAWRIGASCSRLMGFPYVAFTDPRGGGRDAFTVAIAHRDDGERVIVDCVRAWNPPFNPAGVVAECAELLKMYSCQEVTGDRYAGEWPREAFRSHSIEYEVADLDRSRLYLELIPHVNAATVEIPNDAKLLWPSCAGSSDVAGLRGAIAWTIGPALTTIGPTVSPAWSTWRARGTSTISTCSPT
jgi:hypothetical protein